MIVAIYITFKEYNTFYLEITPACYKFVNDCNHFYKFCLTFCSHMSLNLPMVVLVTRNLHSWIQENQHQVTHFHFKEQYSVNVWCGALGNNLIDHMDMRDITQSCYNHIHPHAARGTSSKYRVVHFQSNFSNRELLNVIQKYVVSRLLLITPHVN